MRLRCWRPLLCLLVLCFIMEAGAAHAELVGKRRRAQSSTVKPLPTELWRNGLDPMSYWQYNQPFIGYEKFKLADRDTGFIYHFLTAKNRAIFSSFKPEEKREKLPRYDGHDPVLMARGYAEDGQAGLFEIHEDQLFLFLNVGTFRQWLLDRDDFIEDANNAWRDRFNCGLPPEKRKPKACP